METLNPKPFRIPLRGAVVLGFRVLGVWSRDVIVVEEIVVAVVVVVVVVVAVAMVLVPVLVPVLLLVLELVVVVVVVLVVVVVGGGGGRVQTGLYELRLWAVLSRLGLLADATSCSQNVTVYFGVSVQAFC